jgi:hypothetical protein
MLRALFFLAASAVTAVVLAAPAGASRGVVYGVRTTPGSPRAAATSRPG